MIHLDTHVLVWAYGRRSRLTTAARRALADDQCVVSPATVLELEVLFELRRVDADAAQVISNLQRQVHLSISESTFADVVEAARGFAWTRDPFDRLIVANAMADGARLVTADDIILRNFPDAVW